MSFIFVAVIIAQTACVIDMLLSGRTLRLPVAGGALTASRKGDRPSLFYFGLILWIALFIFVDMLIWG
jgi:hypothetical protein